MAATPAPKIVLLDVDGTLLHSAGAGRQTMNSVFAELFGVARAFDGIEPDGKTDPAIFREILQRRRIPVADEDDAVAAIRTAYEAAFPAHFAAAPASLLPGAATAVTALVARHDVALGILTGNLATTTEVKLRRFGLASHFGFGAYSSDSEIRSELVPIAVTRAAGVLGRPLTLGPDVIVVGDTPLDVACALANGVRAVGVGAARYSERELAAAGAHATLPDLNDLVRLFTALELPV